MYEDRVRRGAELLDRVRPGWASEIDLDRLFMIDCYRCVLGQLFGEYGRGIDEIDGWPSGLHIECGFSLGAGEGAENWEWVGLTSAWRAAIRERLDAAPVATGAGKDGR